MVLRGQVTSTSCSRQTVVACTMEIYFASCSSKFIIETVSDMASLIESVECTYIRQIGGKEFCYYETFTVTRSSIEFSDLSLTCSSPVTCCW